MKIRHSLVAILALTVTPALAFDLPPPVEAPEYTGTISTASGWYIRGDLGYNVKLKSGDPTMRSLDPTTGSFPSHSFDDHRFGNDFTLNAGGGYQFNDFLRTDLTLDYFSTTMKGKTGWEACGVGVPVGTAACKYQEQDMTALGLLLNGYVDLGTYLGMTPYVGAGAGLSYVKWGDVNKNIVCTNCGEFTDDELVNEGADSWRFTYALMTGFSYDLTDTLKLDFGYRFSQIDDGNMFNFSANEKRLGAFGMKGRDQGLTRHEFRTGLRLTTW